MLINVTKKITLEIKLWKKTFYRWELKQKAQAKDKEQEKEEQIAVTSKNEAGI